MISDCGVLRAIVDLHYFDRVLLRMTSSIFDKTRSFHADSGPIRMSCSHNHDLFDSVLFAKIHASISAHSCLFCLVVSPCAFVFGCGGTFVLTVRVLVGLRSHEESDMAT